MNPVFLILVGLAAVGVWFLISPWFGKIGDSVSKKGKRMFGDDEDKENDGKEEREDE